MKTKRAARFTLAALLAVVAASFACAGSAFAATVHGADYHGAGQTIESGQVDVLNVDGQAGETVFLTVERNGRAIAKNLPYTIGEGADAGDGSEWAGVATLDIDGLDLSALDGTYTVKAYASRAGADELYSGALYGVYADLPGDDKAKTTSKLIGTRTASADEAAARTFNPPATVFADGRTYKLASDEPKGKGALHYAYEEYDEATSVDGVINYLDSDGNVVAKSDIPGIAYGEEVTVKVPQVVVADNGDVYRTVFFKDSITAKNPGAVSFSIYCSKMSEASKALAGFYVATIQMVDEKGNIIASDSVDVTGNFVYTAPSTIYKKEAQTSIGAPAVVTYEIDDSPTIHLSAQSDGVVNRTRTVTVRYSTQDPDAPSVDVAFKLIDGSKALGEAGRSLGTKYVTADLDNPMVAPEATIQSNGTNYNLVGDPSEYAYTIRSGQVPSVNVYYVPEGYEPPGPYEVTVNYVNFLTDEVIESHAYTSDPNDTAALTIETPSTFSAGGVDYVRLDGQEDAISHSYYSDIASYTVYYRDKNDTLTSGTVINSIRVVYRDGGTTVTANNATAAATPAGAAAAGADAAAGTEGEGAAAANGADAGEGAADANAQANEAQDLQLNDGRTYNVFDGEGNNGTMTNESGVNTNTERIEDSETPLASGFDRGGTSSAAGSLSGMAGVLLPVGAGIIVVIIAAAGFVFVRRRNNEEDEF